LLQGSDSPALERYRTAKAELIELDLSERRGELIPRDEIHNLFTRMGSRLRQAGETLQRKFGAESQEILNDALDDIAKIGGADGNLDVSRVGTGSGSPDHVSEGCETQADGPIRD
jgi:hypothetical protein